ncbi:tRNA lysidine(34) synthetase TilS [Rhodobacter maris]|uniref:tRNA(Ile)-lysidine synthase n=1 Tax=Rhodobacter maris TaxID=446682 RepID=A0A285RKA9_9RHOB|nr:tRNA lysidine(34) synthetase TilS [Rhodobacter maris]SOB94541.1 tRNA(Ile)-lysidine synthase [Rhodobacter maris]
MTETPPEALRAALEAGTVPPEDGALFWAAEAVLNLYLPKPGRIGVAVSGGSDSMATLALLSQLHAVAAVTVDHGLRPEAAAEAAFVARFCADRGIPFTKLSWDGSRAEGNLMDAARRARLRLIGAWARGRGIRVVALGHTADDQAETFLMRLAREAGLEGLSGMREAFVEEEVLWLRPFLGQSRADLRGYLGRQGIGWVEDPSNQNPQFERVRARQALAMLAPLGLSADKITAVVGHLAMAEQAVSLSLQRLAAAHVREDAGDVLIEAQAFRNIFDPETARRLINAALGWVSGAEYPPRAAKVLDFLTHWRTRRDSTLHGCRLIVGDEAIRITREAGAVTGLRVPSGQVWDRWILSGPEAPGLEIAALGEAGLKQAQTWRAAGLPRPSALASPGVWRGETLVAAPLAGLENGWKARIVRGSFANALIRR